MSGHTRETMGSSSDTNESVDSWDIVNSVEGRWVRGERVVQRERLGARCVLTMSWEWEVDTLAAYIPSHINGVVVRRREA